ncbi:FtsB family cell division protein [Desulfospira joergensenii]|uniref:FtsB family cell division protein n=1 Tax=Desulfospira joergensenii TaxID=53329 RepID=UPI0003B30964|nr:septum formation initiator family protein [Desulfospira joergensenii]
MTVLEKIGFYLTVVLILLLLFLIFFSRNGILDYQELKAKEAGVTARISAVEKENKQLERQINSLRNDIEYIKHLAKHEHEMVEQGELIFKSKPEKKDKTQ